MSNFPMCLTGLPRTGRMILKIVIFSFCISLFFFFLYLTLLHKRNTFNFFPGKTARLLHHMRNGNIMTRESSKWNRIEISHKTKRKKWRGSCPTVRLGMADWIMHMNCRNIFKWTSTGHVESLNAHEIPQINVSIS